MSDLPIVVIGAGYVGKRLLHRLDNSNNIELGRSSSLDLDRDEQLPRSLPKDYRLLYTVPPSASEDSDVRLARLLAMLTTPPLRIAYISTTGVYGDHQGARVDEQSALLAKSDRARRRLSAESILHAWCNQKDVALTILRTPGIYGPGRLGIERIKNEQPLIRESDAFPGNRIHVDDLLGCCVAALSSSSTPGTYNVGDGDHRSATLFAREVAQQAGLPMPPEISREAAGRQAAESRIVDTSLMRDQLAVTPQYTNAEDGIRASLAVSTA